MRTINASEQIEVNPSIMLLMTLLTAPEHR